MSYYIISTDNCVFLTCEGISSLNEMTAAWREVRDELAQKSLNRVLVNVTALRTSPTTAELFDLAKLIWRDFPLGGRIAFVIRWDQSRLAKSLEMLVRTFGMWLTVFVSEEQAEAWVLEGTQEEQAVEAFAQ
jgi:VanZ family protein